MKRFIIIACNVVSLLIILDVIGAGHMMMMFLFVGIIPGTDNALTPTQMLALMTTLTTLVIARFGVYPILRKIKTAGIKQNQLTARRLKRA
jgi:hypothetical protein